MKVFSIVAAALLAWAGEAAAIERYSSASMSCAELKAAIRAQGVAVVTYRSRTGGGPPLYDRFVAGPQYCDRGQRTEVSYVPARDGRACPLLHCANFSVSPGSD